MNELLSLIAAYAESMIGIVEMTPRHMELVDYYNNNLRPLPRGYKLMYTDPWCAAFVSVVCHMSHVNTFPYECGVSEMVTGLHNQNCLIRGRLPHRGELIFYRPSHVGICLGSNDADGTIIDVSGNANNMVQKRFHNIHDSDISYFASPFFYTLDDVAEQVRNGWYGNNEYRIKSLTENGYDAEQVQALVNQYYLSS